MADDRVSKGGRKGTGEVVGFILSLLLLMHPQEQEQRPVHARYTEARVADDRVSKGREGSKVLGRLL